MMIMIINDHCVYVKLGLLISVPPQIAVPDVVDLMLLNMDIDAGVSDTPGMCT